MALFDAKVSENKRKGQPCISDDRFHQQYAEYTQKHIFCGGHDNPDSTSKCNASIGEGGE